MPIHCSVEIESISTDKLRSLDYSVMGHVFASQNQIGRLADERIYQADVFERLESAGIPGHLEVPVEIVHKTFVKTLYLDLVVSRKAIYELKTVSTLTTSHVAQLLTYLYLLDLPRGKLINFRPTTVESQFVNAPIPREERCRFSVSEDGFQGDRSLINLVVGLVRDWGTSLSISLYHEAIAHLLGGVASVERMLPLSRNDRSLGNQRFHLVDGDSAFELTAFAHLNSDYREQLQRLINLSPLRDIHWINIGPHCVSFRTIKAS